MRSGESRTTAHVVATASTRAGRTDMQRARCNGGVMNKHHKRRALDLFVDALIHPVRLR
jgi:hypothetical protein